MKMKQNVARKDWQLPDHTASSPSVLKEHAIITYDTRFLRNIANHQYCTAMYPQPAALAFKVENVENECLTQRLATT
jgi:hypothetical protein